MLESSVLIGGHSEGLLFHDDSTHQAWFWWTFFSKSLTLLSAVLVPGMDAGVVWYGYPPLEYIDASKIKAPLMAHFALEDEAFPIAKVDALEKKLRDAGTQFEFHRYPAKHAFANEEADSKGLAMLKYDAALAEHAWNRTMAFFDTHLKH